MTLEEQYLLLVRLKCCSALLADKLSTKLQYGACNDDLKLMMLNDFIELIVDYNVEDIDRNCLTEDQFEDIVARSTTICKLCDCEN